VCTYSRANKCNKSTTLKHLRQIHETVHNSHKLLPCVSSVYPHTYFLLSRTPTVTQTHSQRDSQRHFRFISHHSCNSLNRGKVISICQYFGRLHRKVKCLCLNDMTGVWGEERQALFRDRCALRSIWWLMRLDMRGENLSPCLLWTQ